MFPFWDLVIAPVLDAGEVRSVVEIGALRGDNTRQVLDHLGPAGVLHVIDPVPAFDPSEHERAFPGRYVFHRALSVDVLGDLPPMDAALIDGDHNWYTVREELRLIAETSRAAGTPLPVLVLHDVGWPYGRRDLYYDPDTIPAEHRQPHRRAGMRPGRSSLLDDGSGMSAGLWNAEREGGPRNGVRTALDDFVRDHDRALRVVDLPLYFGLAVVVEAERLDRQPALVDALDHLESATGRLAQIELGESIRLRGMANHHTVVRRDRARMQALADLHLDGVCRELAGADGHGWLAPLRSALDGLRDTPVAGDIVVGPDVDARAVAFVLAFLRAHDLDRSVVLDGPLAAVGSDARRALDRWVGHLDLTGGRLRPRRGGDEGHLPDAGGRPVALLVRALAPVRPVDASAAPALGPAGALPAEVPPIEVAVVAPSRSTASARLGRAGTVAGRLTRVAGRRLRSLVRSVRR